MVKKICVIGEGNWGTAIASLLANNGFYVNLWCHDPKVADSINQNNINNKYLTNYKLDHKITGYIDLAKSLSEVEWIFEAIPVKFLRNILIKAKPYFNKNQKWVILSKGIENRTFFLPSEILDDIFESQVMKSVLAGPSFANDLIKKELTAVDISGANETIQNELKHILENNYFKTHFCNDMIGMQIASASKNVVAIIMGILESKNYSDNSKSYLFTKCIDEIGILIEHFGGNRQTLLNLSGIGDLVLTCFGKHSKNYNLGLQLGKGKKINDILRFNNDLPEGINTIESIVKLVKKNNIPISMLTGIYNVIFQETNFDEIII